ncbi:MAG: hypothetical protein A2283_02040 [Lentisphaerae bacterium RIFOXYA12_FULL_48_11]|nr:MAG: hypothetical protein A2283_02040 [Lentisphaerae bacterium RIFOXYA12_FULL_48_11]
MIESNDYNKISCAIQFLLSQKRSYAIYGMGKYTQSLIKCLKALKISFPEFIFDDKPTINLLESIPVFDSRSAPLDKVDEIILGSDKHQEEMYRRMQEMLPGNRKCIDLATFQLKSNQTTTSPSPKPGPGNINFTLHKDNLKHFHNAHAGQRAFVVGNGPSLRSIAIEKLKSEITLGCNRVFQGFPMWGFHFKYWTVLDETNIRQSAEEYMRELPDDMIKFIPIRFLDYFDLSRFQNCHPINIAFNPKPFPRMSISPEIVYDGWCAVYSLIQLAIIMGCRPIYLLGVDYRYDIKPSEIVNKRWSSTEGRNHFIKDYCKADKGLVWNLPSFEQTDKAFALMKHWNDKNGQIIMNATPGSALEAFPRTDYNSLF